MSEFGPGFRSGRLTVVEPIKGGKFWLCCCDCGQERSASKWHLKKGIAKSCGCRLKVLPQQYICRTCKKSKDVTEYYLRKNGKIYYAECKECNKKAQRDREQKRRLKALNHYGNNDPHCTCCQERRLEFLQLDHGNNDGAQHRKETGIGSKLSMWKWLEKNNYPDDLGLQIQCANCHLARSYYGHCPHQNVLA